MAASALARPGSKHGPCAAECKHRDCCVTRAMATALCHYCGKSIGYEVPFYQIETTEFAHAVCEEDHAEKNRPK